MTAGKAIGVVSDLTYRTFVGAAIVEPLMHKQRKPVTAASRLAGLCAGLILSSVVKRLVPERRPDGSDNKSFPSGHSVATLAVAHTAASQQPERATLWYGGAALETALRAASQKHHFHDVLAGGVMGYFVARGIVRLLMRPRP